MWKSMVYYPLSDKSLIEDAIPQLNEVVFDCWHFPPKVYLGEVYQEDEEDEAEIQLCLEYSNPNDSDNECSQGHDAMDLVQAFISGVKFGTNRRKE